VTKTQSAGPISCLEHHATRVQHSSIAARAAVLIFPLLLQAIINQHPASKRSGPILSPRTHTGFAIELTNAESMNAEIMYFLSMSAEIM